MKFTTTSLFLTLVFSSYVFGQEPKAIPIWEKYTQLRCQGVEFFECHEGVCQKNISKIDWLISFNENLVSFTVKSPISKIPSNHSKKILSKVFKTFSFGNYNTIFLDDGQIVKFFPSDKDKILSTVTTTTNFYVDENGVVKKTISTSTHTMTCAPLN